MAILECRQKVFGATTASDFSSVLGFWVSFGLRGAAPLTSRAENPGIWELPLYPKVQNP